MHVIEYKIVIRVKAKKDYLARYQMTNRHSDIENIKIVQK
jgi:hypothetical protein